MMDDEEDEGPVYDGSGKVVRIHREPRKRRFGGVYFIVWPALIFLFLFIGYVRGGAGFGESLVVIFFLALFGVGSWIYLSRGKRPHCTIDLSRDSISQYEGEALDTEIKFSSTVNVDVVLDQYTKDREYGHLCGYMFKKGESTIEFTAADDWHLWDIQAMRGPIFEVVDFHRMKQGKDMREYRNVLAGGIPKRDLRDQ